MLPLSWLFRCLFAVMAEAGLRGSSLGNSGDFFHGTSKPITSFEPLPLKVLITGFQPFGSARVNPAELVALSLDGTCHLVSTPVKELSVCFEGLSVPVDHSGTSFTSNILKENPNAWDAILHLGLESVATGLKLETIAMNILATEHNPGWNTDVPCDKTGTQLEDIVPGGDCLLATTAPLNFLNIPALLANSFPTRVPSGSEYKALSEVWSRDAGAYYCNEIFYRTLSVVRGGSGRNGLLLPVLFVHLPDPHTYAIAEMQALVKNIGVALVAPDAYYQL